MNDPTLPPALSVVDRDAIRHRLSCNGYDMTPSDLDYVIRAVHDHLTRKAEDAVRPKTKKVYIVDEPFKPGETRWESRAMALQHLTQLAIEGRRRILYREEEVPA